MFEYTTLFDSFDSSFIKAVYHDSNDDTAAVVLDSGDVYYYSGVNEQNVRDLTSAYSVGSYYNTTFKPTFGPSEDSETFYPQDFFQAPTKVEATKEYSLYSTPVFDQTVSGAPLVSDATPEFSLAALPDPEPTEDTDPEALEVTTVLHYVLNGTKAKFEATNYGNVQDVLDEFAGVITRLGLTINDVTPTKVVYKFE